MGARLIQICKFIHRVKGGLVFAGGNKLHQCKIQMTGMNYCSFGNFTSSFTVSFPYFVFCLTPGNCIQDIQSIWHS